MMFANMNLHSPTFPLFSEFFQNFFDQDPLIHRMFDALDLLIIFMSFSCQNDHISRLSVFDRVADRLFPITDLDIFSIGLSDSLFDVVDDRLRILEPRIVR